MELLSVRIEKPEDLNLNYCRNSGGLKRAAGAGAVEGGQNAARTQAAQP
jgi:hypothetical protein